MANLVSNFLGISSTIPIVAGKSVFGGYCGPAIKPITLKILTSISQDNVTNKVPISGIGGISNWKDVVEFM